MKRIKITNEEWNALEKVADNAHADWFYEETYSRKTLDHEQLYELIDSCWMDINVDNLTQTELDLCKVVFERAGLYKEWVANIYNEFYPKAETPTQLAEQEKKSSLMAEEKNNYDSKKYGCCKYMAVPNIEVSTDILRDWNNSDNPVMLRLYPNAINFYDNKQEISTEDVLFYNRNAEYKDWVKSNMDKIFSCLYKYHTMVDGKYVFHNGLKSIQKLANGNPIYERQMDREIYWKVKGFNVI